MLCDVRRQPYIATARYNVSWHAGVIKTRKQKYFALGLISAFTIRLEVSKKTTVSIRPDILHT